MASSVPSSAAGSASVVPKNEVLLWPKPAAAAAAANGSETQQQQQQPEIDLFRVINSPGNDEEPSVQGPGCIEILPAKLVFDPSQLYNDCSKQTQECIVEDLKRCYERTSGGRELAVKEWANENQNRGILRLRLRCKKAQCKLQFQVNWDREQRHWFISRQCENLYHTCPPPKPKNPRNAARTAARSKRKTGANHRNKMNGGTNQTSAARAVLSNPSVLPGPIPEDPPQMSENDKIEQELLVDDLRQWHPPEATQSAAAAAQTPPQPQQPQVGMTVPAAASATAPAVYPTHQPSSAELLPPEVTAAYEDPNAIPEIIPSTVTTTSTVMPSTGISPQQQQPLSAEAPPPIQSVAIPQAAAAATTVAVAAAAVGQMLPPSAVPMGNAIVASSNAVMPPPTAASGQHVPQHPGMPQPTASGQQIPQQVGPAGAPLPPLQHLLQQQQIQLPHQQQQPNVHHPCSPLSPAGGAAGTTVMDLNNMSIGANSVANMSVDGQIKSSQHFVELTEDGSVMSDTSDLYMMTVGSATSKLWMSSAAQPNVAPNGNLMRMQSDNYNSIGSWFDKGTTSSGNIAAGISSENTDISNRRPSFPPPAVQQQPPEHATSGGTASLINDLTMNSISDSVRNMLSLVGKTSSEDSGIVANAQPPMPAAPQTILAADFFTPPPPNGNS